MRSQSRLLVTRSSTLENEIAKYIKALTTSHCALFAARFEAVAGAFLSLIFIDSLSDSSRCVLLQSYRRPPPPPIISSARGSVSTGRRATAAANQLASRLLSLVFSPSLSHLQLRRAGPRLLRHARRHVGLRERARGCTGRHLRLEDARARPAHRRVLCPLQHPSLLGRRDHGEFTRSVSRVARFPHTPRLLLREQARGEAG